MNRLFARGGGVIAAGWRVRHMAATADLCDKFGDSVKVVDAALAFRSFGQRKAFGGPIATVKCFEDNSVVKAAVTSPGDGKVLVVDGGGSSRRALLGDDLAMNASKNGWAGIVINGYLRDSDIIQGIDIGVKALGTVPRKTEKRNIGERDVTVEFGGARFIPGHFVYCDPDGIVVSDKQLSL
ncbi:unnamed protein product (mitochondrion) [Plasmodiophora brassicae]|uniref:4-hydroxy-4-methyl-2-oxoglutarate aldolase n=1 Tax=Plasmodiophora brassicae TaxID=37360 RepID=A0A0G4J6F1_PLABS|nr:hypothetical protein PBRA_002838 [Plasmodiophora brassicae]SPQ94976.1 unnamed protein product [Plasmodiophora brassicae]